MSHVSRRRISLIFPPRPIRRLEKAVIEVNESFGVTPLPGSTTMSQGSCILRTKKNIAKAVSEPKIHRCVAHKELGKKHLSERYY